MAFRQHESSLHRLLQRRSLRRPEVRLWVPRAIRLLKTSLKQIRLSRFFRWPGCTKWVRIALRHLKTSHHRLQKIRFLDVQKADLEFTGLFSYIKYHLNNFAQGNFSMSRMQKMCLHSLSTLWNITLSTSLNSFFKTYKRLILSCKGQSST
jgi:hypothetical protein